MGYVALVAIVGTIYAGALSYFYSHCNAFEDQVPVGKISWLPIFKWIQLQIHFIAWTTTVQVWGVYDLKNLVQDCSISSALALEIL